LIEIIGKFYFELAKRELISVSPEFLKGVCDHIILTRTTILKRSSIYKDYIKRELEEKT